MKAVSLRRAPPLPELVRLGLIGALLLLATVAWLITDDRMAGMDMGPGTDPGTLGFWITAWVVMMAAMMFPSIAPMVVMYVRIQAGKRDKDQPAPFGGTALFVGGYLLAWSLVGLGAYAILAAGHELSPGFLAWDEGGRYVAGAVIVAALIAIEKLLPWKALANRSVAVLLAVMGLAVALAPERVPGLTVPSDAAASDKHGMSMAQPAMRP